MMKTDLHKKTGHTGAPRLRLPKKAPAEPEKDTANPYRMPPRRWFLTFMCMNIPIAGWVYLLCLAFGKKENQLRDFAKAYLVYKAGIPGSGFDHPGYSGIHRTGPGGQAAGVYGNAVGLPVK